MCILLNEVSLQFLLYGSNYMIFWNWYTVDIEVSSCGLRRKLSTVTTYYLTLFGNSNVLSCPYKEQILVRTMDFR